MKLSANRVVLILHGAFVVCTAVGVFVAYINNSLPHAWQPAVATGLGILAAVGGGTVAVTKFLDGSQKQDQRDHEYRMAQLAPEHASPELLAVTSELLPPGVDPEGAYRPGDWSPEHALAPQPPDQPLVS